MWSVGTAAGRELPVLWKVPPFPLVAAVPALAVALALSAFARGGEAGRALGAAPGRVRLFGTALLSGAADDAEAVRTVRAPCAGALRPVN
ncbi:hypothetical protein [Streptomyces sindenensis]|uniref:Uncharacterized protein n=1 Tax=Streptomyces sindenensis TaxID=67363 RepID=A0ABW6E7T4_9ACTN